MSESPLRFLADENFSGLIVKALRARFPHLDIVRVQDTGSSALYVELRGR